LWEDDDATVVCKHLGMGTSGRAKNIDQDYNYTRSMFNVYCTGHEYSLFDCSYDTSDVTGMCYSANDAAVECINNSTVFCPAISEIIVYSLSIVFFYLYESYENDIQ
jgi:hypothetical protein